MEHEAHHAIHSAKTNTLAEKIWEKRVIILLLIAVFLIAFGIRAHLLRYDYLFEFDAFYHARLIQDIVTIGHVQSPDPLVYYEMGGAIPQKTSLYHIASAWFYELISFGQPFSKDLLMFSIRLFSVLMGALIAVMMYFLAKETFNNKKVGMITAFVTAVCPAFAYRTMAGAQGDNSFGFIWMAIGFYFFIKTIKTNKLEKKDIINTLLAGIFFGAMAVTWGMYILIPLIVLLYIPFGLLLVASREEHEEKDIKKNHAFILLIKALVPMLILFIVDTLYGNTGFIEAFTQMGRPFNIEYWVPAAVVILGIIAVAAISIFFVSHQSKDTKKIISNGTILLLYLSLFAVFAIFLVVPDVHNRTAIASMVGEESNGNQFFGTKYNSLIIFAWVALAFFPISIWLFKKQDAHTGIVFYIWIMITLFMAWYTLKFTFVFGLGIALAAAVVSYIIFEGLKKFNIEKGIEAKALIAVLFFLIVLGAGASARFFPDYVPYVDQNPTFLEMMNWIDTNTPTDAKFFNWWNDGHILAFLTERKYSSDNRNQSHIANRTMGRFIVTEDTNYGHYMLTTKDKDFNFNADYLILEKDYFGQMVSFAFYVPGDVNYSDPTVRKYAGDYIDIRSCTTTSDPVNCNGLSLSKAEFDKLPQKWTSTPTTFIGGTTPVFIYSYNGQLIIIGNAINNSNLAKIWFNSDETKKYYTEVFSNSDRKVFEILK